VDVSRVLTVDGQNVIKMSTKLTLQVGDEKISWEKPEDGYCAIDIVDGFYKVMLGTTFFKETILKDMQKFINNDGFTEKL